MTKTGTIACGAVSASPQYNQRIKSIDRHVLAIETESGGIFEQATHNGIPAVTIRGISDLADRDKNGLETRTKGINRSYAADNAVSFLRLQMQNPYFIDFLRKQRTSRDQGTLDLQTNDLQDPVGVAVAEAIREADEYLRELSPEYRLLKKGYRLPLPRIRPTSLEDTEAKETPREVREVIREHKCVVLTLPRNYPDASLPWALANDLVVEDVEGKQIVPMVVEGSSVTHKFSLDAVSKRFFKDNSDSRNKAQQIFIINEPPLSSKTERNKLIGEISSHPDARFIIVTRAESEIIDSSGILDQDGAATHDVCDVSFIELTGFIQRTFDMTEAEAEVVALRLRNTFQKFALSAYPTYFAGIPKDTLTALLHANRRSELIQLAVDGFLTFLVADDDADVSLSRTTRSRFLRKLAIEISANKQSLTQSGLIDFAKKFAADYDFPIDPIQFINAFQDKGIIHFDNSRVEFSLPFIHSYLLAEELAADPTTAARYFDPTNEDFDLATFDLYAEIGADPKIVSLLQDRITQSIQALGRGNKEHAMLEKSLQPSIMNRLEKLERAQQGIRDALSEIRAKAADRARKQEVLDLCDRIREATSYNRQTRSKGSKSNSNEAFEQAGRSWVIGVCLLGSGAEHLEGKIKQKLASDLVSLGSLIVHHWVERNSRFDFDGFRKTSAQELDKILKDGIADPDERKLLIGSVLDAFEYDMLGGPFRRIMHYLSENARAKVLRLSVEKAVTSDTVEQLVHALWLSDIDSKKGVAKFRKALKQTPAAPFFRLTMATHIFGRVYWAKSKPDDRLRLIDAAAEAMKGAKLQFDKGKVVRRIKHRSKSNTKGH
jgi:hypothetical protein